MPEFTNAFSGLAAKRQLTHTELVRAIRYMIAAEYEAIQLYEQLAESTTNALARKVLYDIADEEKEHAGEFRRLLMEIAPDDEQFYTEGESETEENIKIVCKNGDCACSPCVCSDDDTCCSDEKSDSTPACEKPAKQADSMQGM